MIINIFCVLSVQLLSLCTVPYQMSTKPVVAYYHSHTVCSKKSDAKIEITITTTNLIRIRCPLSSFNYRLSGANVANFNEIHCSFWATAVLKNGTQKQKFPIWKSRLSSSYTIPSVTVCTQSVAICTDTRMSLVQTVHSLLLPDFLSADPVVSICRRSRSSAEQDQSLSGNSSNNFLAL